MNKGIIMKFTSFLLTVGLLVMPGISQAREECKFTSGDPVLIMSPPPVTIVPLPVDAAVHPTLIASGLIMETVPQLRTECTSGKDGLDVFQYTDNALQTNAEFEGKTLFGTNVPGIFYTLAFFPDGNGVTAWFPARSGGSFVRTGDTHGSTNIVDDKTWHVRMDFYQTNMFEGVPSNVNFLTLGPGTIGQIVVGNPDTGDAEDHPRPQVSISQMSFDIVANRPTCGIHAPTIVDLGEWSPKEVENGQTTKVKFKVTGTCANTGILWASIKSNHATSDGQYILNEVKSNPERAAAGGVGVKIKTPYGSKINQSYAEAIAVFNSTSATPFEAEYEAQLLKYSDEPVTVGPFGSNLIMQFTYE